MAHRNARIAQNGPQEDWECAEWTTGRRGMPRMGDRKVQIARDGAQEDRSRADHGFFEVWVGFWQLYSVVSKSFMTGAMFFLMRLYVRT